MGEMAELFLSSQDDIDFYDNAASEGYGFPKYPISDASDTPSLTHGGAPATDYKKEASMDIRLLKAEEIECKVKQVTEYGAVILLYKTARTDMDILDEVYGPMNWETDYKEIKGNLYCGIGVRDETGEFVWKWDCGIESREDSEGNQRKGEASDAFKRAGFKWGIGRELYTGPQIRIPPEKYFEKKRNGKPTTSDKFEVEKITYDENRRINALAIRNVTAGKRAFVWQA